MTTRNIFFAALLQKTIATKMQRHEAKKAEHFSFVPWWLCG